MRTLFIIILFLLALPGFSQQIVTGNVYDTNHEPVIGVNIFIEGTYDGGSSDVNGQFRFKTREKGLRKLKASFIGYKTWEKEIDLSNRDTITITLRESVNSIDAVTITAGTFAASDEKRASILQPLDISRG